LKSVEEAEVEAQRVVTLASGPRKIPTSGAITLLREDAMTQGPRLFAAKCASCHTYIPPEGAHAGPAIVSEKPAASNLYGFGSRAWVAGLLNAEKIAGPDYFGHTGFKEGEMAGFVKDTVSGWKPEEVESVAIALSAEAKLPAQRTMDKQDAEKIEAGKKLIVNEENCVSCHKFHDAGELGSAPDLSGYGSREWLIGMIANPAQKRFYPDTNEGMPAFAEHEGESAENLLSRKSLEMLVDWLRGEWYEPGREPAAAAAK
jgi:ubiquinol-cytochrome c reductase cytochrome b subunit